MESLRGKVRARRNEVRKHVYIEEVYIFDKKWQSIKWLSVDGLRIKKYTGTKEDEELYNTLYERYYLLHRHILMTRNF